MSVYLDTTGSCCTQPHLIFFLGPISRPLHFSRLPILFILLIAKQGAGGADDGKRPLPAARGDTRTLLETSCHHSGAHANARSENEIARSSFSLSADVCMYHYCTLGRGGLIRHGPFHLSKLANLGVILQRRYGALCCLPETPGDRKGLQHFSTSPTQVWPSMRSATNTATHVF